MRIDESSEGVPEAGGIGKEVEVVEKVMKTRKDDILSDEAKRLKITKKEVESLLAYQGNEYYEELNRGLREGKELNDKLAGMVKDIDSAILKSSKIRGSLYRGISLNTPVKKGDKIQELGLVSSSSDLSTSYRFAKEGDRKHKYLFKINIIDGIHAVDMNNILADKSLYPSEDEYLLPRGNNYIIKNISKPDENDISEVEVNIMDSDEKILSESNEEVIEVKPSGKAKLTPEKIKDLKKKAEIDADYYEKFL